jgi:serine/threonine-protein kinase RsbW
MRPAAPQAIAQHTSDVTYLGTSEQVRAVRADLRPLLHDCPMADDVILCASELAANAVLHSRSGQSGGTFTVRAAVSPGCHVRIEVADNGGPWLRATSGSAGRHGLDIVRALTTDWGIEGDHAGRTVWARFDRPDRA